MIDIRVPYFEDMELGRAYNLAMRTVKDWVLFIDHDIILSMNPYYYSTCKQIIKIVGHKAGWITCKTNRIACTAQRAQNAPKSDDIIEHIGFAKKLWNQHKTSYSQHNNGLEPKKGHAPFSGFFMLTHKKAWEDVKGFKDGFLGVDNDYYLKLIKKGYDAYVLEGIYVYHVYRQKSFWEKC